MSVSRKEWRERFGINYCNSLRSGKSPCLIGKSTNKWAIFNSYCISNYKRANVLCWRVRIQMDCKNLRFQVHRPFPLANSGEEGYVNSLALTFLFASFRNFLGRQGIPKVWPLPLGSMKFRYSTVSIVRKGCGCMFVASIQSTHLAPLKLSIFLVQFLVLQNIILFP